MLKKTEGFSNFKSYIFKQLEDLFKKLGLKSDESHSFMDTKLQTLIANMLCKLKYDPCVKLALEIYEARKNCKFGVIKLIQHFLVMKNTFHFLVI